MPNAPYTNLTQLSRGGDGTVLGQSAADPVALHGKTAIALAALAVTTSATDATTAIALVNAIRTAGINKGLWT